MRFVKPAALFALSALVLLCLSCCAKETDIESSKDISHEISGLEISGEESNYESVDLPEGDGIAFGYHTINAPLVGDIAYATTYKELDVVKRMICLLDEDAFVHKYFENHGTEATFANCKPNSAVKPQDMPKAVFSAFDTAEYKLPRKPQESSGLISYDEAKESNIPFYVIIETVLPSEQVITDLQSKYGVTKTQAVSLYRNEVINTLEACGIYLRGWFDLYSFDSEKTIRFVQSHGTEGQYVDKKLMMYDDSVYNDCTNMYFFAYATGEALNALKTAAEDDGNGLFKVVVTPISLETQYYFAEAPTPAKPYEGDWKDWALSELCDIGVLDRY